MRQLFKKYFIIVASIYSIAQIVPALVIHDEWAGIFYAAFILSLLLYIAKPIINLLLLPFNLITLNLVAGIVNIIVVFIWTFIVPAIRINPWEFPGISVGFITLSPFNFSALQVTVIVAILLTVAQKFFSWLIK